MPYSGGMQAITDMLGGTIHLNIGTASTLVPLIREGKIRASRCGARARYPDLPDVPTMIESGFPGLSLGFWAGLWAPAGTPAAIVDKLNAEINAALGSPEMKQPWSRLGVEARHWLSQDFAAFIADRNAEVAEHRPRRAA